MVEEHRENGVPALSAKKTNVLIFDGQICLKMLSKLTVQNGFARFFIDHKQLSTVSGGFPTSSDVASKHISYHR